MSDRDIGQYSGGAYGKAMDQAHFDHLVNQGFEMPEKATEEISVPEDNLFRTQKP